MSPDEAKAKKAAYDLARRLADPERKRAASRAHYLANREQKRARAKAWAAANPGRMAEYQRAWRARDPERSRQLERDYYRANREKFAATRQRYRAAKKAGGGLSEEEWLEIVAEFDGRCAYCSAPAETLEIEHMTPLSRGGLHHKDNVVPACGPCNRRKGRMTALEFISRSTLSIGRQPP